MKVVLLGAAGTGTSFAIATRIRANWGDRVKLIITDTFDEHLISTSLLADKFYKVPLANDPSFYDTLRTIIIKEKVQTYIPILSDELINAEKLMTKAAFQNIDIWSSKIYSSCTNKKFAYQWLSSIGIKTPQHYKIDEIRNRTGSWFAKPQDGFGSSGAKIITQSDLRNLEPNTIENLLFQEICEKPEVTIDSFYDSSNDTGYAYCRERLETKSGVCTKARLFHDEELSETSRKIGKALDQRGTICFQVMKSNDEWVVTDLNLRPGAGTAMTCAAGFDVISAAFACRTGEDYSRFLRHLEPKETFYITRQYTEFVMRHET